jgi:hypothetical protein
MVLGNIQRFEVVVGCFNLGAFHHAESDRSKNAQKFFVGLPDQVTRADGAIDAGKRKINFFAGRRGRFASIPNHRTKPGQHRIDLSFKCV